VAVQNPVQLDDHSEPQPDFSILKPRDDDYRRNIPRPQDVLLIVEVAASSLRFDRRKKVPLYARHAVPEVWLVDLGRERLVRYRSPERGTYSLIDEPDMHASLAVGALERVAIDLRRLFGWSHSDRR
jgi:Uma2 family endonuclease